MKRFRIILAVLMVVACLFTVLAIATSAEEASETEEKTITISYVQESDLTSTTTTLDKTAYSSGNGAQTVKAGEKFTLPTTANDSYLAQEGYVLVWYTSDGHTYEAGEEVSFEEDTRLFRAAAKQVSTRDELNTAMTSNNRCAILVSDIETTGTLGTKQYETSVVILNGHTLSFSYANSNNNGTVIGSWRSSKQFIGEGSIIVDDTNDNIGKHAVFNLQSHGYGGGNNKVLIGKDVTVDAPEFFLAHDNNAGPSGYPQIHIYGKVNVYSIVYNTHQSTNMDRPIFIYDGAEVTLSANAFVFDVNGKANWQRFDINISGGIFNLPQTASNLDFWTADFSSQYIFRNKTYNVNALSLANVDEFNITGGSFNVQLPFEVLKNGYQCIYNEATGYYDVTYVGCTLEGSNGVHDFAVSDSYEGMVSSCEELGVYYFRCPCGDHYIDGVDAVGHDYSVLVSETPATCVAKAYKTYKCVRCDSTQNVEYGSALGHDYSKITIQKVATATENGMKCYTCVVCAESYTEEYSFDPGEQTVELVVKTEDGTKTVVVTVSSAYNIVDNVFNGVNTFADPDNADVTYTIADIVKLVIPTGVTGISTDSIKGATALTEIVLLDGANATFAQGSIVNCASLEKLTVGECTVVFRQYTVSDCANFATIDVTKANATFESNAFKGNTAVKHLLMSSGHTYNFGTYAFASSGLVEVILPDDSTVTLSQKSFAETTTIEYVYIGKNCIAENANGIVALGDDGTNGAYSIFGGNAVLSKVVMMDIEYVAKWVFSVKTSGNYVAKNDLYIYCHSSSIDFHSEAINDRKAYNVYIYVNEIITIPSTCNYVIYKGIPHAYVEGTVEATCTAMGSKGYTTDCPCGIVAGATYTIEAYSSYTGSTDDGTITIGEATDALGHEFTYADTTILSTTPATCLKNATITYQCTRCDETETVEQENTATGHTSEAEWQTVEQVTCTKDGLEQKNCTVCKLVSEARVVEATGHSIENVGWVESLAPTCTLAGTEVKYCVTCGVIAEAQAITANGHTEGEWTIKLNPDCDDDGIKEQYCTVCSTLIATEVIVKLGHEFDIASGATLVGISYPNGFASNGQNAIDCARCTIVGNFEIEPIFGAKGYSTNSTHTALNGGFALNTEMLSLYEQFNGEITYGIIIANANSFGEGSFVDANNKVNSANALQVAIDTKQYSNFDCSISNFGAYSSTLELIICAYVIDTDGNISFIQAENDYAIDTTVGEQTFTKVTLDLIVANVTQQPDAILPDEE